MIPLLAGIAAAAAIAKLSKKPVLVIEVNPAKPSTSTSPPPVDVGALGVGVVAAHGFDVGTKGFVKNTSVFRHKAFEVIKKFLGAMAWASAIGLGLLIYTHFTQKWRDHGYPAIPLEALTAVHNAQGQIPAQPRASPYNQGQQPSSMTGLSIDAWDG